MKARSFGSGPAVRVLTLAVATVAFACGALAGCGGGGAPNALLDPGGLGAIETIPLPDADRPPIDPTDPPPGATGALVRFDVGPDHFHVLVTDEDAIDQLIDIHEGREPFTHFLGLIRAGSGVYDHNLPWTWYLAGNNVLVNSGGDPLTSFTGSLQALEALRDELVRQDKYYLISSPNAALTQLYDYR